MSTTLKELYDQGFSPSLLAKQLMNNLRDKLIEGQLAISAQKAIKLLKDLLDVDAASDPNSFLLLTLIGTIEASTVTAKPVETKSEAAKGTPAPTKIDDVVPKKTAKLEASEAIWPDVLNELKNRYNTLYGIVRMAQPVFKDNNQLDLIFDFAFHKKQVSEAKNKQVIASIILELTDQDYHIETYLSESKNPPPAAPSFSPRPKNKDLENISKIFGGGELVD
jgi:hypothetical protein